jgi:hypothetical protein
MPHTLTSKKSIPNSNTTADSNSSTGSFRSFDP